MKIKITESQLRMLIEAESAPTLNGGDLVEYPGSTVSPTTNVMNPDGEYEYGKPLNTGSDRVAKKMSTQNNYINGKAGISRSS